MTNELVQNIAAEESTSIQWVNSYSLKGSYSTIQFATLLSGRMRVGCRDEGSLFKERVIAERSKFFPLRVDFLLKVSCHLEKQTGSP